MTRVHSKRRHSCKKKLKMNSSKSLDVNSSTHSSMTFASSSSDRGPSLLVLVYTWITFNCRYWLIGTLLARKKSIYDIALSNAFLFRSQKSTTNWSTFDLPTVGDFRNISRILVQSASVIGSCFSNSFDTRISPTLTSFDFLDEVALVRRTSFRVHNRINGRLRIARKRAQLIFTNYFRRISRQTSRKPEIELTMKWNRICEATKMPNCRMPFRWCDIWPSVKRVTHTNTNAPLTVIE